jgi:hypothetical protein
MDYATCSALLVATPFATFLCPLRSGPQILDHSNGGYLLIPFPISVGRDTCQVGLCEVGLSGD